ncbi:MAG: hypothetical protein ACI4V4_03535 [Eubacterium sp.]
MKKLLSKIIGAVKLKKEIKAQIDLMTSSIPCVNLSVRYNIFKGFYFYNNSDLVALFTYDEIIDATKLGKPCFDLLIYCLCIKNSIDKY